MALLCGQLSDGIATPIVGILSDKYDSCWGKRNTFYIVGSMIVIPSFLCLFTAPIWTDTWCLSIWYIVWPMIFNVGWASVQVSHMAIVNSLTYDQEKRDQMINSRNGFTYAANIAMLSFSVVLFIFEKHSLV
jgi:Na+/melibiose symporter-like transporter